MIVTASNNPFSEQSSRYSQYRPTYPTALFEYLALSAPANNIVWDCATGNGQAAQTLSQYFDKVIATDVSEEQLSKAVTIKNIEYKICSAENSGIESGSVDLIAVAQALHWFDLEAFFGEAERVLKPQGVLAAISYNFLSVDKEIDNLLKHLYGETLGNYWSFERKLVEEGYKAIEFPFAEIATPEFNMEADWSFEQLIGYLETWSALKAYKKATGENPIEIYHTEMQQYWGDLDKTKKVIWPLTLNLRKK